MFLRLAVADGQVSWKCPCGSSLQSVVNPERTRDAGRWQDSAFSIRGEKSDFQANEFFSKSFLKTALTAAYTSCAEKSGRLISALEVGTR